MDGIRDHHVEQNKLDSERQIFNVFSNINNLDFFKDKEVERGLFGKRKETVGGERGNK
jgi:hypothetical protein